MFCGNVGMSFYCNMCTSYDLNCDLQIEHILESYADVHYQLTSVIYHLTYESHLQDFEEWLACGGSTNGVWNDICTFYENLCEYVVCSKLSSSTHFVPQNKVGSYTISTYCIGSSLQY